MSPMTDFMRDGYWRVPSSDRGNHSIAATVTEEFLDFFKARENDLRRAGLTDSCAWYLWVNRWKEAMLAGKGLDEELFPEVSQAVS
jgi:uncharacterized protein